MLSHTLLQRWSLALLDLLFPPRCVSCKQANSWLCEDCLARLAYVTPPVCSRCGAPLAVENDPCRQCRYYSLQALDGIRVAAYFEDNPIRPAIHSLKYRNQPVVAAALGHVLCRAYQRYGLAADVLVPVPLHPSRLRQRGYNQSELLAREAGRCLGVPVNTRALQRTRQTRSQMTLGASERHQNVFNAFRCSRELSGLTVVLVDDVCTTGSTLDACAAALKAGNVAAVWGLTLARAR